MRGRGEKRALEVAPPLQAVPFHPLRRPRARPARKIAGVVTPAPPEVAA